MKSNIEILHQRGYFEKKDVLQYISLSEHELRKLMNCKNAHLNSIAIFLLYQQGIFNQTEDTKYLIQRLYSEKYLYTKITICDVLAKGGDTVAKLLISHLGNIGHNQYKDIGKSSFKKSYPIARDIIARTLCNMEISSCVLLSLFTIEQSALREAIDVIGYQLFYHPTMNQLPFLTRIEQLLNTTHDQVLIWKCLTCLSAISLPESVKILEYYLSSTTLAYQQEAQRSLNLIKTREKK